MIQAVNDRTGEDTAMIYNSFNMSGYYDKLYLLD